MLTVSFELVKFWHFLIFLTQLFLQLDKVSMLVAEGHYFLLKLAGWRERFFIAVGNGIEKDCAGPG